MPSGPEEDGVTCHEAKLRCLLKLAANTVHPSLGAITCIRARTGAAPADFADGGR